ncbi:hypothetical protein LJR034_001524 [Caballeronia sp. LjRoot34]|uniref:hypothetical protein n=1 Tax=Caballeronia sp. LjRoot34 TaxID=3342325 RepID=UPI003ED15C5E
MSSEPIVAGVGEFADLDARAAKIAPARKPVVSKRVMMWDWIQESITLRRGRTGAKLEAVRHWAFERLARDPRTNCTTSFR